MKKAFIALLLASFILPVGIYADTNGGGGQAAAATPSQSVQRTPDRPAQPFVDNNTTQKQEEPKSCPEPKIIERIIERTITKEIIVLPKGMTPILSIAELKKLKKSTRVWKDWDGRLYELK